MWVLLGGDGYVGTHLTRELTARGHEVEVLGLADGDFRTYVDPDWIEDAETVVLLAGVIRADSDAALVADNLAIARRVLDAYELAERRPALFFTSSLWVYDSGDEPLSLDSPTGSPRGAYGQAKLACEQALIGGAQRLQFPLWIGRASNLVALAQPLNRQSFVRNMHDSLRERGIVEVRGDPVRDLVRVRDFARGLELRRGQTEPRSTRVENVCSGRAVSLRDVGRAAVDLARGQGRDAELVVDTAAPRDAMIGVPNEDSIWGAGPSVEEVAELIAGDA